MLNPVSSTSINSIPNKNVAEPQRTTILNTTIVNTIIDNRTPI